ncbi:hypothetical protein Patl1_15148 [Pistacia atlantica]|uniref:Uncharacterized protein n=1 Tax=Pistacia atlantica TaxID=434234 RepID=A0ACC1B8Z7_9ROSI|nr:hypothetical protein Patl1_15148 [Pistacia atlantica]
MRSQKDDNFDCELAFLCLQENKEMGPAMDEILEESRELKVENPS